MKRIYLAGLAFTGCLFIQTSVLAETSEAEANDENVILVTAALEKTNVLKLPTSVTVVNAETIARNNAHHFSDILNLAPNVNFATGASRGRFVQIRGVGERSEFAEPVNYSVGVVVDGIDLTGIATAATLLDIQQVEILRGPQGTLYGANGLAGLINIVSNSPTDDLHSNLSVGIEQNGGRSLSAIVSDSPSDKLGYRFAIGQYQSDGFINNVFLNRDNTNNIDETSVRGKLVFQADNDFTLTGNLFYVDADNGYDAFSLDSNRNTYSDMPGFDKQETKALALTSDWKINKELNLETILSSADSQLAYAYDEDWSHTGICEGTLCDSDDWGFDWWYSSFDSYQRENKNNSLDVRLSSNSDNSSTSWVVGYYYRDQQVDLVREYTYLADNFTTAFDTVNSAVYGQFSNQLNQKMKLTAGLRFENRSAEYIDSNLASFSPDEDLWGGKLSLQYQYSQNKMFYALISRGYKAGGFNASSELPESEREYETEFMWNYEAGLKGNWLDNNLILQSSVFYQDRDDIQSKQSLILSNETGLPFSEDNSCPCSFNDYIKNAEGGGVSYGLEFELKLYATDSVEFYSSLGILKTKYKNFESFTHMLADRESIPPVPYDMNNRAFAHSPEYQAVVGLNYFMTDEWAFNVQLETKDAFYFSDRHEVKSDSYELFNMGLSYRNEGWGVKLFVRNITDEKIQTRGFGSFPNDPRNLYEEFGPYYQFAAPRMVGVSASVEFD